MLRRELTIERSMAWVAAGACRWLGWMLVIGGVLLIGGRATRGAQPEPPLPAGVKPAVEGTDAVPPKADKPAAEKRAIAPLAEEKQTKGPNKGLGGLVEAVKQKEAEAIRQAPAEKRAADQALGKVTKEIKRVNPAVRAQANNLAQQWRPVLTVELSFVRLMCPDLPPAQRVLVKAAGEQALFAAADSAAGGPRRREEMSVTPQAMIRDALSKALREALPADGWERFAAEAEARSKRRQTAVIRLVVQHLDESLYLSQEQRDQISRSLADRWQAAWESWLQSRYARNLPVMPDDVVTPFLDADQRQAFSKIQKVQFGFNTVQVNPANVAADNGAWWDEALPAAKDAVDDVPPP